MNPLRFLHGLRFGIMIAQNELLMINLELTPFRWELWARCFGGFSNVTIQVGPICLSVSDLAQIQAEMGPCDRGES
jgi:hypothetical protein